MKKLSENITNLFGEKGRQWLNEIDNIVEKLATHWQLMAITPIDNMTFNYVAKALCHHQPVVLKISYDEKSYLSEMSALNYFNGDASIQLIDFYSDYFALLLQQAVPGTTLKSLYPNEVEFVMNVYVKIMRALHKKHNSSYYDFPHSRDWLNAIDRASSCGIPKILLDKARFLKDQLLSSSSLECVLHGDLHHDNILKHHDDWLAIDPKGIIGEPAFEIAAFDFIAKEELNNEKNVKELFNNRVKQLAEKSSLNEQRIRDWVFVRLILSAIWSVEDNSDPAWAIQLADTIS